MLRTLCKGKIHRATITEANLNYVGSITIDEELLERSDILPYEQVHVVNVTTGARFITYAITGERGSGMICLNGAAARLGHVGDIVIVIAYGLLDDDEARRHEPKIVLVDENNKAIPSET